MEHKGKMRNKQKKMDAFKRLKKKIENGIEWR